MDAGNKGRMKLCLQEEEWVWEVENELILKCVTDVKFEDPLGHQRDFQESSHI